MSDLMIRNVQRALGVGGLVWAIFLLPRTNFSWWIAANVLYGVLALISAGLLVRGHRRKGRAIATAGVILFPYSMVSSQGWHVLRAELALRLLPSSP